MDISLFRIFIFYKYTVFKYQTIFFFVYFNFLILWFLSKRHWLRIIRLILWLYLFFFNLVYSVTIFDWILFIIILPFSIRFNFIFMINLVLSFVHFLNRNNLFFFSKIFIVFRLTKIFRKLFLRIILIFFLFLILFLYHELQNV